MDHWNAYAYRFFNNNVFLIFFSFLATGDSFYTISCSYRVGVSTVCEIVHETTQVIWRSLCNEYMTVPDKKAWIAISEQFRVKWNFPNCLGAIDGKHVAMQAPNNAGSLYFNYKGTHSIVLLAVVDADLRFIIIDVGATGRFSDGGIFARSQFGQQLLEGKLDLPPPAPLSPGGQPQPHVFVADEAFPLKPYILRPYSGRGLPQDRRIFNYRLSRGRRNVETLLAS
jgi:hypothetical protein